MAATTNTDEKEKEERDQCWWILQNNYGNPLFSKINEYPSKEKKDECEMLESSIRWIPVFPPCKNHGNLEASTECLIEEQAGLELWHKWKPW